MVQSYKSEVRVYKYPFELVMAAYEKRFPSCPQIPDVIGSEKTSDVTSDDGSQWVVERSIQLNPPFLFRKVARCDYIYFSQKNTLDRRTRTLRIDSSNLSFQQKVTVTERCVYYVHPDNANWTCYEESASLDVKSFYGFENFVEKMAVDKFTDKLSKSKEIMEHFIGEVLKSGIMFIPPFVSPTIALDSSQLEDDDSAARSLVSIQ